MLDKIVSGIKKRVKMLTLMMGVATAPLMHTAEASNVSEVEELMELLEENRAPDLKKQAPEKAELSDEEVLKEFTERMEKTFVKIQQAFEKEKKKNLALEADIIAQQIQKNAVQKDHDIANNKIEVQKVAIPSDDKKVVEAQHKPFFLPRPESPFKKENMAWLLAIMAVGMVSCAVGVHQSKEDKSADKLREFYKILKMQKAAQKKAAQSKKSTVRSGQKVPVNAAPHAPIAKAPTQPVAKDSDKTEKPVSVKAVSEDKNAAELHKKGVRMLGVNKLKRAALRHQKKELMAALETANEEQKARINTLLEEIAQKSKVLTQERRQACALIQGQQGEWIKEQRRLYAKKMAQLRSLMKKDGLDHQAEIEQINAARQAIKETYKKIMDAADQEVDKRAQSANYKHGLRLLHEVQAEQAELDACYEAAKTEKGLKSKKDILAADDVLCELQKRTTSKKRRALTLIKGRSFTRAKIRLNKRLKQAKKEQNAVLANQLTEWVKTVENAKKDYVQKAQAIDYTEKRKDMINPLTAQRINQVREAAKIKQERLEKARLLRGQRMLYHLSQGQSTAVNANRVTPQAYRQEAFKLMGASAKTVRASDYPQMRRSYSKGTVLAGICQHQKARNVA